MPFIGAAGCACVSVCVCARVCVHVRAACLSCEFSATQGVGGGRRGRGQGLKIPPSQVLSQVLSISMHGEAEVDHIHSFSAVQLSLVLAL